MALREKFGRLVLLEKTDSDPLGDEWSAARLGPSGLDRLVSVLRFSAAISAHADATKRLVDEARLAAQVHGPALLRVLGVGRVGQSFYVSTELAEGRTLRAILARCADEGFPFAVDHALMIASRSAAGLELLHGRKDEGGQPLVHGLLTPGRVVVAFDGEVKLKGLGLWGALGPHQLLAPEECLYLAPEQAGGAAQPRSDVYALGLVLLEALSGQRPEGDPFEHIAAVRIASPGGDPAPLPKPLVALLSRALARDPAARYPGTAEMRKAIDALLFSGDFTPTTFDLAFFMHTLFRDDVEADTRALDAARAADYREFLTEDAPRPAAPRPAQAEPALASAVEAAAPDAAGAPTAVSAPTLAEPVRAGEAPLPSPPRQPPVPLGPDSSGARLARAARESSSRGAFGATLPRAGGRRALWVALGLIAAAALVGGAGWLYVAMQRRAAAQAAASAEQAAAQARVKELETRIAQLEKEKREAEARAAEDARQAVEQQAAAGGKTADPAAIASAQEAARQRARVEQERRQQEELARLADARRAEEQRLAASAQAALATPAPTPLPPVPATSAPTTPLVASPETTVTPTTTTAGTPAPLPTASAAAAPGTSAPGAPLEAADPGLRPPILISQPKVRYPAIAIATHAEGVVELHAVVDETGTVTEVKLIRTTRKGVGFEGAAEESARGRKYRPATKDGVPVKTQVRIVVTFTIPR